MEFDSAGSRVPSAGMDGVRELVLQLLPSSHLEFPPEKVIKSHLYFLRNWIPVKILSLFEMSF